MKKLLSLCFISVVLFSVQMPTEAFTQIPSWTYTLKVDKVKDHVLVAQSYACPAACPGPRGAYKTSCYRGVCISTPREASENS